MSSSLRPVADPAQFDVMFWLPPAGTDKGIWAGAWAELADLDAVDIDPILGFLATADVGAMLLPRVAARAVANSRWCTGCGWIRCSTTRQ